MPRSPVESFSALIRTGLESGPLGVLFELFAWRSSPGGHRAHAQAGLRGESPDVAAPSQRRLSSGTLDDRPAKQRRDGILRVDTTDIDEGKRVVEGVLRVTAKKWHLRSFTPSGGDAIVLKYECRLRRAYTPGSVRARVLHQGVPFVRAAEWDR
jgi:hypothetical protein